MYFKKTLLKHFSQIHNDEFLYNLSSINEKLLIIKNTLLKFDDNVYTSRHYPNFMKKILKNKHKFHYYSNYLDDYSKFSMSIYDYLENNKDLEYKIKYNHDIPEIIKYNYSFNNSINNKIINDIDDLYKIIEIFILVDRIKEKEISKISNDFQNIGDQAKFVVDTKIYSDKIMKLLSNIKLDIEMIYNSIKEDESENKEN